MTAIHITCCCLLLLFQAACGRDLANIALWKKANQSSEYEWPNNPAIRAVDGSYDGNKVSRTQTRTLEWWSVDLGTNYHICRITLWNRGTHRKPDYVLLLIIIFWTQNEAVVYHET